MDNLILIISSTIFCFFITLKLTPIALFIGEKKGLVDWPNTRKQHEKPKVRIGGISITVSFLIGMTTLYLLNIFNFYEVNFSYEILVLIFCSLIMFLIGISDDIFNLNPFLRLFIQIIATSIIWAAGIRIDSLDLNQLNLPIIQFPVFVNYILTVFWIVGVVNAINWIDGLDGLAAGITSITTLSFIVISICSGNLSYTLLSSCLLGGNIGFLILNKYPSQIMMGDGGSYFLGFVLSIMAIKNFSVIENMNMQFEIIYPIIFMSIPLFDMIYVIFKRISNGKSIFFPDRSHIHHRLIDLGFNHPKSVNYILIWVCWFNITGLLGYFIKINSLIIFFVSSILFYFFNKRIINSIVFNN